MARFDLMNELQNFSSFFTSGKFTGILKTAGTVLIYLLILGVIYWYIIRPMLFNIKAIVFEKRASGSLIVTEERLRKIKRGDGEVFYIFYKSKDEIPPIEYGLISQANRKKPIVFLEKYADGSYSPIDVEAQQMGIQFKPVEIDIKNWAIDRIKVGDLKYDKHSLLKQYIIPAAIFIVCMVVCMILIITVLNKVGIISGSIGSVTASIDGLRGTIASVTPAAPP